MKKQKLLQSFLLVMLLIVLAPSAYAVSEVAGTLSSNGSGEGSSNRSSSGGIVSQSSSSGGSGSSSNSSSGSSEGIESSGSTTAVATSPTGTFSGGTGSINEPSVDGNSVALEETAVDLDDSSNQLAQAFLPAEEAGIGIGTWLLIVVLVLALVAVISYLYNRTLDDRKPTRV